MSKTNKPICCCHYDGQSLYDEINRLSESNLSRLIDAKKKREEIGGEHLHLNQIQQLPDSIDIEKHGIHSRPCYKL